MGQKNVAARRMKLLAPFVGLAFLAAGCAHPSRETFDLAIAPDAAQVFVGGPAIGVREPMAMAPTSSDRIVVRDVDGSVALLSGAQWSAPLPRLLRARIIEALQRRGVGAARVSGGSNRALATDVRRFEIDVARSVAVVEIASFIVEEVSGATRTAKTFVVERPTLGRTDASAASALAGAASEALAQMADWARGRR
jgi:cholesterol transport system auxiliary component